MKPSTSDNFDPADVAASWVMRHDRGLSPAEQDEFLQWLAADPCHGEAMARHRRAWENFDRLAGLYASVPAVPDPDLLAPRARARGRSELGGDWLGRPCPWLRPLHSCSSSQTDPGPWRSPPPARRWRRHS